jgi:6-phosphogluconolactonase
MPYELLSYPTDLALAQAAAAEWLVALRKRSAPNPATYSVALSGGRIAKTFFSEIVKQVQSPQAAGSTLFQNVHFFWGDERCVPPDDPESNFNIARQLLLGPLKIPEAQIHRLRGEGPESLALSEAVGDILKAAPAVKGQPVLDLIFLGMGEDGHVASLFPGEPDEVIRDEAVYRAVTAAKPPPRRITLGYAALAAAREVWVIASGAGKEGALKQSLAPKGNTPLARVLRQRSQTRVLTDIKLG